MECKVKKLLLSTTLTTILVGCAIKPVELPQEPFAYDHAHSIAQHYAKAMGINNVTDLPKGKAEQLLKERHETMLEAGLSSGLTGYMVSFAFAKALGLPTSLSHDLASDTAEDQFILGAGSADKKTIRDYDNLAIYLPYELADTPESARRYVFDYFVGVLQDMGLKLEDIESEYEYGTGHPFTHVTCTKLDTECRYRIKVRTPVAAYAPEQMGGYKAWVWTSASKNPSYADIYNIGGWGNLLTFDMKAIADNEKAVQASFSKPMIDAMPDWAVEYKTATYNEAPFIRVKGQTFKFEKPE